jgi:PAS domain S-box-containing protein
VALAHTQTGDALQAFRESEEKYRFLTETVPVQIWTAGPDGRLDYVSHQTAAYFGLAPAQILADGWQNVVHADDLPRVIERWTHALQTGEDYEVEFRLRSAAGAYLWHLGRAVAQRSIEGTVVRWFGTNTNIEEQREHQRHVESLLRVLEERSALLALEAEVGAILTRGTRAIAALQACAEAITRHLDAAFSRIWTTSPDGTMLELQASAGLYTHTDGAHGRVPVGQLKIGQIAAERRPHLTNQVVGDPRVGDQEWAIREGMVAFVGHPILIGDEVLGVIAAFARRPISDAVDRTLESVANAVAQWLQRRRADGERDRALAHAESASRAKDEFLATASHELRTPLNAILGWVRLLRGGSVAPSAFARGLETIERNAKAQVQLIEDILDGSRIITGKLHLEVVSTDLTMVVRTALDGLAPAADAKAIAIDMNLEPSGARILADPDRLQQIVWNLVNNALKFTPKGGRIEVAVAREGTSIVLSVRDNGQGIAPEFLPHIFERFRQADGSSTRRATGLGLGLALVRHLAEAHGGTVRAESEGVGRGATFVVTLPVRAILRDTVEFERPTRGDEGLRSTLPPASLNGFKVLVVDNEADARELVSTVLRAEGAEVTTADSAEDALLELARAVPHVIVSDVGMPVTDGYSLMGRVRALSSPSALVPAIALTAYAREEDRRRALAAGFHHYLAKPADPETLVRMVGELGRARP